MIKIKNTPQVNKAVTHYFANAAKSSFAIVHSLMAMDANINEEPTIDVPPGSAYDVGNPDEHQATDDDGANDATVQAGSVSS